MRNSLLFRSFWPSILALIIAFLLLGCEKERTDDFFDPAIANSPKMEAYVIAKYDLQQSIIDLRTYLGRIDLSKLEWVEENGRMVMHLPGIPPKIEAKVAALNEANSALLSEFPQIASFSSQTKGDYLQYCTQNSVAVNNRLLDLGINAYQVTTKRFIDEWGDVMDFLDDHMGSPNYVEVTIIGYADGGSYIYIDPRNTAKGSYSPDLTMINGVAHYPEGGNNSAVVMIAHTHRNSPDASDFDKQAVYPPGVVGAIYYDGAYYKFKRN